ncbi:hypothetical protein MNEG_9114, partial [Monoraphidium neglectum]
RCSQYQALGAAGPGGAAADKRCRVFWRKGERRPLQLQPWAGASRQPHGQQQQHTQQQLMPPASPMSP